MELLNFFRNMFNADVFIDGKTTFLLSSYESPKFKGPYKGVLVKTIRNKKNSKAYLIEINMKEGDGLEYYIISPKYIGFSFGKKKENDVYIYEPLNIDDIKKTGILPDNLKILAWGHIHNINNESKS